jgi:L-iditol 2-dehydrogenase
VQAAVLYGQEDVRVEEVPEPILGTGEVLVRVTVAPTCGTDLKVWLRGGHARMLKPPTLFGHEFAGVIEAVADGIDLWQVGDRVVANNSAPCFDCFYCRKQRFSLCEQLTFNNGTFAEWIRLPAQIVKHNLQRVPAELPLFLAALTEPLACCLHGVDASNVSREDTVLVIGDGAIGLMLVAACADRGAQVILCGGQDSRLALGKHLGAIATVNYHHTPELIKHLRSLANHGRGLDIVIEATGQPTVWETAIACARPGATVTLFGGCPRGTQVAVDTENLHYNELTLKGVFHNTPHHVREALALLASRRIPFEILISEEMPLDKLPFALAQMRDRQAVKVAIRP